MHPDLRNAVHDEICKLLTSEQRAFLLDVSRITDLCAEYKSKWEGAERLLAVVEQSNLAKHNAIKEGLDRENMLEKQLKVLGTVINKQA